MLRDDRTARRLRLAVLCISQFMLVMDFAIVNVALPEIRRTLDFSESGLAWVASAYALTFGGFLLVAGRLADVLGRKRTYLAGVAVFTLASVGCALAGTPAMLVAARAFQGVGAALAAAPALALIVVTTAPGRERVRALAVWGAMGGIGAATGLVTGGTLTGWWGWPAIFLVNLPAGALVLAVARAVLPADPPRREAHVGAASAATATAGIAALILAASTGGSWPWLTAAAVFLGLFAVAERRAAEPLVPYAVLRRSGASAANVSAFAVGGVTAAYFFTSPYMQEALGYSPVTAGIAYLVVPGGMVTGSSVAGRTAGRVSARSAVIAGSLAMTAGLLLLARAPLHGSYVADLMPGLALLGFGRGLAAAPLAGAALEGVDRHQTGVASGLVNTALQLGAALGVALFATIGARSSDAAAAAGAAPAEALVAGVRSALHATSLAAAGAALAAALLMKRSKSPEPSQESAIGRPTTSASRTAGSRSA
jgi:MFS family permease